VNRIQCNSLCRWRWEEDRDHRHSVPNRWYIGTVQYWLLIVHAESSLFLHQIGFRESDWWISQQFGCSCRFCSRV